jgi:hypothetical protein
MTEPDMATQTPEAVNTADDQGATAEAPQAGREAPETGPPEVAEDAKASASAEAKRYRLKLRETESERDTLRERVDALERAEVERIASNAGMATPADLWALTSLDAMRADGRLDRDAAHDHVAGILRERPTWRRQTPDLGAGARGSEPPKVGLSSLLGKR